MNDAFQKSFFDNLGLVFFSRPAQALSARFVNRRVRNRSHGGVGGRRGRPRLLPDWSLFPQFNAVAFDFPMQIRSLNIDGFGGAGNVPVMLFEFLEDELLLELFFRLLEFG